MTQTLSTFITRNVDGSRHTLPSSKIRKSVNNWKLSAIKKKMHNSNSFNFFMQQGMLVVQGTHLSMVKTFPPNKKQTIPTLSKKEYWWLEAYILCDKKISMNNSNFLSSKIKEERTPQSLSAFKTNEGQWFEVHM